MPNLPTRLAAIRARLAKATPGPWFQHMRDIWAARGHIALAIETPNSADIHNAIFISHAPADLAFLLDTLEAALRVVEAAKRVQNSDTATEASMNGEVLREALTTFTQRPEAGG